MSEELTEYKAKPVMEFDPFRAMDKLDDKLILDELEGRVSNVWVYSFPQDGKKVEGLSKIGVDQACREMAKQGEVIREGNLQYNIDPTDKRYVLFAVEAKRIAVNREGGEIVLDSVIGTKRQCVNIITRERGITDKQNPFWYEQGAMKAARNARMRLISEETRARIITLAREGKKTREVTPDDDIPDMSHEGVQTRHDEPATDPQQKKIFAMLKHKEPDDKKWLPLIKDIIKRDIASKKELTKQDAKLIIDALDLLPDKVDNE